MPSMGLRGTGIVFSEEAPVCVDGQGIEDTGKDIPDMEQHPEEAPFWVDGQGLGGTDIVLPEEAPWCPLPAAATTISSRGGDDDDGGAEQVGRSDGAREEVGHTAVVPSPCCDNEDQIPSRRRRRIDGGRPPHAPPWEGGARAYYDRLGGMASGPGLWARVPTREGDGSGVGLCARRHEIGAPAQAGDGSGVGLCARWHEIGAPAQAGDGSGVGLCACPERQGPSSQGRDGFSASSCQSRFLPRVGRDKRPRLRRWRL